MLEVIDGKESNWFGIWWNPENCSFGSESINLSQFKKFKGNVRIFIKKNKYYSKDSNRPNYICKIRDSKLVPKRDTEIRDIDNESNEERLYTYDEVRYAIRMANQDGSNGYTDIMVEDYI